MKIKIGDIEVEVADAKEAADLIQQLRGGPAERGQQQAPPSLPDQREPAGVRDQQDSGTAANGTSQDKAAAAWNDFIGRLNPQQRKLLTTVKEKGRVPIDDLVATLGVKGNTSISGFLVAIHKHAKAAGIKETQVYKAERSGYGKGREIVYMPGSLLRQFGVPDA